MQDDKEKITQKFIELLSFEGWNQQTLEKAGIECGFDRNYIQILYPGKIDEFSQEFISERNRQAIFKAKLEGFDNLKTTQKAQELIFQRIKQYHYTLHTVEAVRKFASYCMNPGNIFASFRSIYQFSSDSWYEMGDKSTDFSFYTKRISFSSIYIKSFLYSLSDKSDNLQETKKFIQKSIDALMKINKLKQTIKTYIPIIKQRRN